MLMMERRDQIRVLTYERGGLDFQGSMKDMYLWVGADLPRRACLKLSSPIAVDFHVLVFAMKDGPRYGSPQSCPIFCAIFGHLQEITTSASISIYFDVMTSLARTKKSAINARDYSCYLWRLVKMQFY
jgi:hypothetical protein